MSKGLYRIIPHKLRIYQFHPVPRFSAHTALSLQFCLGFMLSILAAHAATTGGVAPAQTTSFQLFKLPGHILQKPSSFGFLHVFLVQMVPFALSPISATRIFKVSIKRSVNYAVG